MSNTTEWVAYPELAEVDLPPDLTTTDFSDICGAGHPSGYVCTRGEGHGLRHAAGNGAWTVAVWR